MHFFYHAFGLEGNDRTVSSAIVEFSLQLEVTQQCRTKNIHKKHFMFAPKIKFDPNNFAKLCVY
jgi:hypothetical protein